MQSRQMNVHRNYFFHVIDPSDFFSIESLDQEYQNRFNHTTLCYHVFSFDLSSLFCHFFRCIISLMFLFISSSVFIDGWLMTLSSNEARYFERLHIKVATMFSFYSWQKCVF